MKFKNYKNPYTSDNKIYSFTDLYNMPFGEFIKNKQEVLGQNRILGVPREEELLASDNVVYVHEYTREDGTIVKAHWRSKPERNAISDAINNEVYSNKNKTINDYDGSITGGASGCEKNPILTDSNKKTYTKEELEKLKYPDEVAGVKRGEPMSFEQAGGNNINPNYDKEKNNGYSKNCAICNVCFDARLEGLNVEALPYDENNKIMVDLSYHPNNAYIDIETGKPPKLSVIKVKNAYECKEWLDSNIKQGEQYSLGFQFKEEKIGHILRVFKDGNNDIVIYDPQRSKISSYTYLNSIDYKSMRRHPIIFRTDDKQINYEVLKHVIKPH